MAPDSPAATDLARRTCPRCAARLRPDAPWCTQCFLDLQAPATAPPVPARAAPSEPARAAPEPYDEDDDEPRWPCSACGTRTRLSESSCRACGLGFLAGESDAGTPVLPLPLIGDLSRLSTARRVGLALLVVLLVMLITAVLGVLFS